jgi:gamma-glutamyltranspeptidase/glutathione hydrolase
MAKALVAATQAAAQAGGEAIIEDGGSASDAVVAAILSVAAVRAGVLLAPMVAVVGGVGAGTRAFDGRTVQPGRGQKRPRGFTPDSDIPDAARSAVPRSLAMLALLQAYAAKRPLSALVRVARATAKQQKEPEQGLAERLDVLELLPKHGATSLRQLEVPLVRAAGTTARGLVSPQDLEHARPDDTGLAFRAAPSGEVAVPAFDPAAPGEERDRQAARTHVVVAADGRGLVAGVSYTIATGLLVPELGLRFSANAVPVMRGVSRVTPGTPLWAPCPVALMRRPSEGWFGAIGAAGCDAIPPDALSPAAPMDEQLRKLREATGATHAAVAMVARGRTSALVDPAVSS